MNKFETAFRGSDIAQPADRQTSSPARIPELDGMRGIAILAVVIAHYFGEVEHGIVVFTFGWPGVTLFFVLSGFLIGSIILEHNTSPNFFRVFYARRALRILPVYFLTITATLGFIHLYGPAPWIDEPFPALSYFTFTQNFGGSLGMIWLRPTWTLAVEEQFYLLTPLLVFLLPARLLLPSIVGGIVACYLASVLLGWDGFQMRGAGPLLYSSPVLLIGVFSAYLVRQRLELPETARLIIPLASTSVVVAVAAFAPRSALYAVWPFMAALFAYCILLIMQGRRSPMFLRSRVLVGFGTISYCLYLIHQPINGVMHGLIFGGTADIATAPQFLVTCAALVVSISAATVSWLALERPLLQFGRRMSYSDTTAHPAGVASPSCPRRS
ncbi:acyltransferase family protein [Bradyrhizobium ivorense]|uniref:acyltransferase family protein n=1 Tax=Bradyrhizobium ivorense TaxID=2511166 RepID=UPI001116A24F|nr:acyltransferase [Bradyrhizobium ivorense]